MLLDLLQGVGKDAVDVLRMIKRRLQAEMKTIGRNDLRMLSRLLQEDDLEVRTVRTIRTVNTVLLNTINHFSLSTLFHEFIRQHTALELNLNTCHDYCFDSNKKTPDFLSTV